MIIRSFVALGVCVALSGCAALAEDAQPARHVQMERSEPTVPPMMEMEAGMMCMRMMRMHGHTEGWLAFLRAEIAITGAQSAAWDSFAAAIRQSGALAPAGPAHHKDKVSPKPMAMKQNPWPDRAEAHLRMMESHLEATRRAHAAAKPLYDLLSTEQKRKADELFPMVLMQVAHGGMGHAM